MTSTLSTEAQWCLNLFNLLNEGGTWGVPRSGLVFVKRGDKLVLTARMPWMPEMKGLLTEAELHEQQDEELRVNRQFFGEAGVEVVDES